MSKDRSVIIKGFAILLMLFYHLFYRIDDVMLCDNLIYISGKPFSYILARAAHPVSFFTILSGYGLYVVYSGNKPYSPYKKVLQLYLRYWLTIILFIPIGYFIVGGDIYPGRLSNIIANISGVSTSWNGEIWFLLPFCILLVFSKQLAICVNKYNPWIILIVSFCITVLGGKLTSWYGPSFLFSHRLMYIPVLSMTLLLGFSIGMLLAKYNLLELKRFNKWKPIGIMGCDVDAVERGKTLIVIILCLICISIRCCINIPFIHIIYTVVMIVLLANMSGFTCLDKIMYRIGQHSTTMWFVHTYFCIYFFRNFIYGFRYPIAVFLALVVISFTTSVVVDTLYEFIKKRLIWKK